MSMGASTSADAGGMSALGSDSSSGMSAMGGMGGGPFGSLLGSQGGGGEGAAAASGQTSSSSIAQWLADPNNRKAIAGLITSGGKFAEDMMNAPPHIQEMAKQVMGGGGSTNQIGGMGPAANPMNPYGGDMAKFITPEMARGVLDSMGIPYGRIRPLV